MIFRHYKQKEFAACRQYGIIYYDYTLDILFGLHVFVVTRNRKYL